MEPTTRPFDVPAPLRRGRLLWPALVGYVLVAASARPLTGPAAVAVLLPGCALLGVGLRARAPLGDALTAALRTTAGRAVVLAVWLWLGWHFLAR